MKSRLLKYLFFLAAAVTAVVYYIRTRQPYQIMSGETMNTYYRIKIRTDKENNLLHNAIRDELQRINKEMSVFDSSSEISSINNDDSGEWIDLSPEMSEVLKDARKTYVESNGNFDPTVGKLVDLWGFGTTRSSKRVPSDEKIKEALAQTGAQPVHVPADEFHITSLSVVRPYIFLSRHRCGSGSRSRSRGRPSPPPWRSRRRWHPCPSAHR